MYVNIFLCLHYMKISEKKTRTLMTFELWFKKILARRRNLDLTNTCL